MKIKNTVNVFVDAVKKEETDVELADMMVSMCYDTLKACDEYVKVVAHEQQKIELIRFRCEAEEMREKIKALDMIRRNTHEDLIARVNALNRLCGRFSVPEIANVDINDRTSYEKFAFNVVDEYFNEK